jgi:hypothetical protein
MRKLPFWAVYDDNGYALVLPCDAFGCDAFGKAGVPSLTRIHLGVYAPGDEWAAIQFAQDVNAKLTKLRATIRKLLGGA